MKKRYRPMRETPLAARRRPASQEIPTTEAEVRAALERLGIEIVDDATAEEADYVICMPEGEAVYFDDDVHTRCSLCGRGIHHRPHVPKRPKKICIDCASQLNDEPS